MQLLEKVRMEVYLPDLPVNSYSDLLETFETELTPLADAQLCAELMAGIFRKPA